MDDADNPSGISFCQIEIYNSFNFGCNFLEKLEMQKMATSSGEMKSLDALFFFFFFFYIWQ